MDSVSQFALGAAVGVAVMGRRTAVWKSAAVGAVCGTLPDLDAFVDHGDAVLNMVLHRADSHALFWQLLASVPLGWLAAWVCDGGRHRVAWWLAVALALLTHPLLDLMTVYGTQLGRPFTDHPYAVGSLFIIDPAYTLPLLVGVAGALWRGAARGGLRWNQAGLLLSTLYVGASVLAQQHVTTLARPALAAAGIPADARLLVTPAAFSIGLWRIVAVTPEDSYEGFHALLDEDARIDFARRPRGRELAPALAGLDPVRRIAAFSHGFYRLEQVGDGLRITDLRMGQEPHFVFSFEVARRAADGQVVPLPASRNLGGRRAAARRAVRLGATGAPARCHRCPSVSVDVSGPGRRVNFR
ncbi:metal-dependent hydrolase [Piscinibacter sakaiensis]|uniref:metal-dependent hydrolase n=1 Tax=Piscinibacter sakaiensis TaxID=1547922 RepID=UPI00372BCE96